MSALRMFIPITKVDAARRLVYGLATAETEDRAGEICDYASTKPLYEKWSEEIAKSTRGKSFGNLRAMHGPVATGKVTAITFNDAGKQIEICAKVVDDAEWAKVVEGVYTGFSQGGAYERRWTDAEGLTRYTAAPNEISRHCTGRSSEMSAATPNFSRTGPFADDQIACSRRHFVDHS